MASTDDRFHDSRALINAVDVITDGAAFRTLFISLLCSFLIAAAFGFLAARFEMAGHGGVGTLMAVIGTLGMLFVGMVGYSATGFLINDRMRNRPQRSVGDALIVALATLPRVLGVLLMILAVALVSFCGVLLLLLLCKIPFVGPVLYFFVFPLSALLLGALAYAFLFVAGLHAPAIWEGNRVMRTLSLLLAIVRKRLMSVVIQCLLLSLLLFAVSFILFGVVWTGISLTGVLSVPILGPAIPSLSSLDPGRLLMQSNSLFSGGAGYFVAAGLGAAILMAAALTACTLVLIAGTCLIFQNVTADLDTTETDARIAAAAAAAQARAAAVRTQMNQARASLDQQTPPAAPPAPTTPTAPPGVAAHHYCKECGGPLQPGDVFCGNCGARQS